MSQAFARLGHAWPGPRYRVTTELFWPFIAAAVAVTAIAVPAAWAGVHKYDTKLSFNWDANHDGTALFHGGAGGVQSKVRKCERGRRVVLFKQRPGADRKFATAESVFTLNTGMATGKWNPLKARFSGAMSCMPR